jgi:lipopolysaccharide/colanic/teichoic acid biosynthesis glycosyltransferase
VLLVALSPLLAAIAAGVRLSSPGPAIFRQERAGRGGHPFVLYKFRSMHLVPATSPETSRADPRVFPLGRVLREYHLDELPQLWNVLVGDMSLVGPRPTLVSQVARYSERERARLAVRPGLTGLAQVSGNNALPWNERIEVDLEYVRRASLRLDLAILWRTLGTVLRREGVYGADGRVRDKP